jgi:SSS family solute:Na+ symporter
LSCVIALYLLFSEVGLVGGLSQLFWPLLSVLLGFNLLAWWLAVNGRLPVMAINRSE